MKWIIYIYIIYTGPPLHGLDLVRGPGAAAPDPAGNNNNTRTHAQKQNALPTHSLSFFQPLPAAPDPAGNKHARASTCKRTHARARTRVTRPRPAAWTRSTGAGAAREWLGRERDSDVTRKGLGKRK